MVAVSQRILGQVFLVLLVGLVKGSVIDNGRFDRLFLIGLNLFRVNVMLKLRLDLFGNDLLFLRGTKDEAPVLTSSIVPLSIQGGRVVKAVKEAHHLLKDFGSFRGFGGELNVQYLHVTRRPAADLTVGRIFHAVGIGVHKTDLGLGNDAGVFDLKVLDNVFFGSPVAPEIGFDWFLIVWIVTAAEDCRKKRNRKGEYKTIMWNTDSHCRQPRQDKDKLCY